MSTPHRERSRTRCVCAIVHLLMRDARPSADNRAHVTRVCAIALWLSGVAHGWSAAGASQYINSFVDWWREYLRGSFLETGRSCSVLSSIVSSPKKVQQFFSRAGRRHKLITHLTQHHTVVSDITGMLYAVWGISNRRPLNNQTVVSYRKNVIHPTLPPITHETDAGAARSRHAGRFQLTNFHFYHGHMVTIGKITNSIMKT